MRLREVAFMALPLALAAVPSRAQVPAGPVFTVSTYTTNGRRAAIVAQGRNRDVVVIWEEQRPDASVFGVFGRIYDDVTALGSEFQVNTYALGNPIPFFGIADVAASDTGFIVVWSNNSQGILGQRFDWAGQRLGAEFQVNTSTGHTYEPRIASTPGGAFQVVWFNRDSSHILRQGFDAQGVRVGAEFLLSQDPIGDHPNVAMDSAGASVLVWGDYNGQVIVNGRRFDAAGAALGDDFTVSTLPAGITPWPDVAFSPGGGFMVAWEAYPHGVRGRVYDAAGTALTGDFQVSAATTAQTTRFPSVAAYGPNNFVVAWHDEAGFQVPLRARTFDSQGNARGPEFTVSDPGNYLLPQGSTPRVATDEVGNMTVAWTRLVPLPSAPESREQAQKHYREQLHLQPDIKTMTAQSSHDHQQTQT